MPTGRRRPPSPPGRRETAMDRPPAGRLLLALVALCGLPGCGADPYAMAPVSGRVTVDGQPVAGLRVSFEPIGGRHRPLPGPDSTAVTDADGRYTLSTTDAGRRGAVVGPCRVR